MALGILEDRKLQHVPGTSILKEQANQDSQHREAQGLKKDKTGTITLVPQPSDDPNDPLNWPLWRRDLILGLLSFVSVVCATASPLMAANSVTVSIWYARSFTETALLTGYHLAGVGVAGFLFVPLARVWGKRHLFLLGAVLMIVSSAWGGASQNSYTSLLWARVFQGVALAPFEALVNTCVGDLYFVHERGPRMAFTNVALFGGAFLTPVFAGKITEQMGWTWTFYFIAIFVGASLPLLFFFCPETVYVRASHLNTDMDDENIPLADRERTATSSPTGSNDKREALDDVQINGDQRQPPPKQSFQQMLLPFSGRKTNESFWKLLLRPFPLFFHPAIFWGCLIQGVIIGWTVFVGVVLAAVFLGPPLWFTEVETGYLYTGAFIGSILGLVLSGLMADWINKVMIRLNNGVYEPEFRILLVFPMMIFCAIGLYGFALTASDIGRYGWLIPDVFLMFIIIGMVMGAVASALYLVDAHRELTIESFTCLMVFKNVFSFILTYFAYDWINAHGIRRIGIVIASIQIAICATSIPMYIFGKRNRSLFSRYDVLKMAGLR